MRLFIAINLTDEINDHLEAVKSAMNRVDSKSFRIEVTDFGRFGRKGGDIYWAGIGENNSLSELQKRLTHELKKDGFAIEDRGYFPHLTLGRQVHLSDSKEDIFGSLKEIKKEMTVSKISLMKSERIEGTLTYTEIFSRNLSQKVCV